MGNSTVSILDQPHMEIYLSQKCLLLAAHMNKPGIEMESPITLTDPSSAYRLVKLYSSTSLMLWRLKKVSVRDPSLCHLLAKGPVSGVGSVLGKGLVVSMLQPQSLKAASPTFSINCCVFPTLEAHHS